MTRLQRLRIVLGMSMAIVSGVLIAAWQSEACETLLTAGSDAFDLFSEKSTALVRHVRSASAKPR